MVFFFEKKGKQESVDRAKSMEVRKCVHMRKCMHSIVPRTEAQSAQTRHGDNHVTCMKERLTLLATDQVCVFGHPPL